MHTRSLATAILIVASPLGPACAPAPGTCIDNTDCAFGQVCLADGVCAAAGGGGSFVGDGFTGPPGPIDPLDASALGEFVTSYVSTGRFEGRIGPGVVEVAEVNVNLHRDGISAWFSKQGNPGTFLYLRSQADLESPGVRTVTTGLGTEIIQACDTSAAYDEFFPSWEVEVAPPREATADDPIIAEDTVTVVDVTVDVVGEGSDVSVTFALPVL